MSITKIISIQQLGRSLITKSNKWHLNAKNSHTGVRLLVENRKGFSQREEDTIKLVKRAITTSSNQEALASLKTTTTTVDNFDNTPNISQQHQQQQKAEPKLKSIDFNATNAALNAHFENSQVAYQSKSLLELTRGLVVFHLCSISFIANNQKQIMNLTQKILGKRLFKAIMKNTFYGHFVAGENQVEIRKTIEKLTSQNVKTIFDYSVELDIVEENCLALEALSQELNVEKLKVPEVVDIIEMVQMNGRKILHQSELIAEKNVEIFLNCIETTSDATSRTGITALKFTSLVRPEIFYKFNEAMAKSSSKQLSWDQLLTLENDEFLQHFGKDVRFSLREIGELKNMMSRIDQIIKVGSSFSLLLLLNLIKLNFFLCFQKVCS
jgi:hypothetical protein